MSKFPWTRTPDFSKVHKIDYNTYWMHRGFELNRKLKSRETIICGLIEPGAKVLDIGCGNSLLPVRLKEKGCEIAVADISDIVLANYEELGIPGYQLDLERIAETPLSQHYDYIILSEVLEHTANPEEIVSVLMKSTDHLIISIPNSAYIRFRWSLLVNGRFFTQWVYHPSEHLRYWSHIDFIDWLRALKLNVVDSIASNGFTRFKFFRTFNKNLFGFQIVYLCKVHP